MTDSRRSHVTNRPVTADSALELGIIDPKDTSFVASNPAPLESDGALADEAGTATLGSTVKITQRPRHVSSLLYPIFKASRRTKRFSSKLWSRWRNYMTKQKTINSIHFTAALLVTMVNIVLLVILVIRFERGDRDTYVLRFGSCTSVHRTSVSLKLAINILSTLLLWGSNLSMQLALAPTRGEVDEMHERGLCFDIGVSSFKNFWRVPSSRRRALIVLAVCSTILHFLCVWR